VPTGADFPAIAGGSEHSPAIKGDGSAVAWGYNFYGQCDVPTSNGFLVAIAGGYGHSLSIVFKPGDGNYDGKVDSADLALWQQNHDPIGTLNVTAAHVPEPATLFVMTAAALPLLLRRRRNRGRNPELASGLRRRRRATRRN